MATRVPKEFTTKLQGKEFVLLVGLLDLAHQDSLKRIETKAIQLPSLENKYLCIIQATVETEKGIFQAHGDASPDNVNAKIAPHIVRMAETRAIGRALRFATNVAMTAFEELGDLHEMGEDSVPSGHSRPPGQTRIPPLPPQPVLDPQEASATISANTNQLAAIWRLGKKQGWDEGHTRSVIQEMFSIPVEHLNKEQASVVIRELQTHGNGRHGG